MCTLQTRTLFFCYFLFCVVIRTTAQAPEIEWQRSLGGSMNDRALSVEQTADGGYILAGSTESNNGDVSGYHGGEDAWVVKLDFEWEVEWQRALGGSMFDRAYAIKQTPDGGYIMVGSTSSNDGDVSGSHGESEAWVVKLTGTGEIEWQRTYGGSDDEVGFSMTETPDGNYLLAIEAQSNDGDVLENLGFSDFWIVKINGNGEILRQGSFGGSSGDVPLKIASTTDGGNLVCGYTYSNNGHVTSNEGEGDYWVVKLNQLGELQWQRSVGGSLMDFAYDASESSEGGYFLSGISESTDGHITDHIGGTDAWLVKLDASGEVEWSMSYGGTGDDSGVSTIRTEDPALVIAGGTTSLDGDVNNNNGQSDGWMVKLSEGGEIIWQSCYGSPGFDGFRASARTADGGCIVTGTSGSPVGGDVSANNGGIDAWIVKFESDPNSIIDLGSTVSVSISPNPFTDKLTIHWPSQFDGILPVQLFDARGAILRELIMPSYMNAGSISSFDLSNLLPGAYYLVITSEMQRSVLRIVKL